jgi:hypothetical protein
MRGSVVALLVAVIAGSLTAALGLPSANETAAAGKPAAYGQPSPNPAPQPTATRLTVRPEVAEVALEVRGQWSWALRELNTGAVVGGGTLRNPAGSLVKSWLAVDFLAARESRPSAGDEARLTRMIRAGDDRGAQTLYRRLGGDASITRMIRTCGLPDTRIHPGSWSTTTMSAADASSLGRCVARGPGVSPQWRDRLLDLMRPGDPGTATGIPAAPALAGRRPAVENGWTRHGNWWTVNCLAVWDHWVLAVLVHYPDRGEEHRYGTEVCQSVAQQLFGRTGASSASG